MRASLTHGGMFCLGFFSVFLRPIMPMTRQCALLLGFAAFVFAPVTAAQSKPAEGEVRQVVTFLFLPSRLSDALTVYERQLKPIYTALTPLKRFRLYRESESPEPLDLVVVSSYDGMAGMDAANEALRQPSVPGASAFALYGTLSAMTQSHHDQFVLMLPSLSDTSAAETGITVFEYLRLVPAARPQFEARLKAARPYEKLQGLYEWSETGALLVSDQWDYLRIHHMRSLADWQRFNTFSYRFAGPQSIGEMVASRKTIILRMEPRGAVR